MTNNLTCTIQDFDTRVKLATYNVDQSKREERYEDTKWINREKRVRALIQEMDADIVCLQELRHLEGNESNMAWLGRLDKYHFEFGKRNADKQAFGQAILYDPSKFYAIKTVKRWLSDTPEVVSDNWTDDTPGATGFGYLALMTRFLFVKDGKIVDNAPPFWVVNVHFGMDEEVKTKSCHKILDIMDEVCGKEAVILAGDLNLFPDMEAEFQRPILKTRLRDLGDGATTLQGTRIDGTFIGYDHDEFKSDLKIMVSRLDHVMSSRDVVIVAPPLVYNKTMLEEEPKEMTTRMYPSDHLPVLVVIQVMSQKKGLVGNK